MPRALITADRIRVILADARTEKDAAQALQRHRVRYTYSTAGGYLHIRIPGRAGIITVTKTASRTAPLRIEAAGAAGYPFPLPRFTWDD